MTALEDCHLCTINNEENSVNNAFFARKFVPVAQSLQILERHGDEYGRKRDAFWKRDIPAAYDRGRYRPDRFVEEQRICAPELYLSEALYKGRAFEVDPYYGRCRESSAVHDL